MSIVSNTNKTIAEYGKLLVIESLKLATITIRPPKPFRAAVGDGRFQDEDRIIK